MLRGREQRRLATVLFLDIVDSTRVAADVGDRRWRELLRAFRGVVRRNLRRHGGHEVDTAGDGFFAWFEQPASALGAAFSITAAVQELGIDVRCGVHTGELELIDGRLGGIAAHIGARVMGIAGPAQILVTSTVRELVVGGQAAFEPAREVELKGVPGRWSLYRVTSLGGRPVAAVVDPEVARTHLLGTTEARVRRRLGPALFAGGVALAVVAILALRGIGAPAPSSSPTPSPTRAAAVSPSVALSPASSPTPFRISLVEIDPVTNRITQEVRDEHSTGLRAGLIVKDGTLWVNEETVLRRRDLQTGDHLQSFELPPVTWRVDIAFGSIWVFHTIPVSVVDRRDPLTFTSQDSVEPEEPMYDGVLGDAGLFMLATDSRVLEYDVLSNDLVAEHAVGTETQPVYLTYQRGFLYLCECRAERWVKFDPRTDRIVDTFEADRFLLGGAPADPDTGVLWAGNWDARTITPYESEVAAGGTALGLQGPPRDIEFGFASVWVAAEGWVHRIASGGTDVQDIRMPEGAKAVSIGIDERANRVWVSLCYGACPR